jgi:hypothetical protein
MLAAIEASRAYHDLMGDLETAHIRRDAGQPFEIKPRVAMALKDRDSAIQALNHHERSHLAG